MSAKPTTAQASVIAYFNGGPVPAGRITQTTYDACERNGWIKPTDVHPFHRTTDAGRLALRLVAERTNREQAIRWIKEQIDKLTEAELLMVRDALGRLDSVEEERCETCGEPWRLLRTGAVGHCEDACPSQ